MPVNLYILRLATDLIKHWFTILAYTQIYIYIVVICHEQVLLNQIHQPVGGIMVLSQCNVTPVGNAGQVSRNKKHNTGW